MCSCLWKSEQRTRGNGWAGPQKGGTTQERGEGPEEVPPEVKAKLYRVLLNHSLTF